MEIDDQIRDSASARTPSHARRALLKRLSALLAAPAWFAAPLAHAADDSRPLRLLVGFPPGGGTDSIARLIAEPMKEALHRPVIVDNRPGAGGQIAAQVLKTAEPDGSTLFVTHDHTVSILPLVVKQPGFDTDRDFVPVGGFATFVNALAVSGTLPVRNFKEYVAWLRSERGNSAHLAVGVPAPASVPEFLVGVIARRYDLDLAAVPYRGSAPMIGDMLSGQIPAGIGSVPEFVENHRAGKLTVIAVLGAQRQAALPQVPTFGELGLTGFEDVPFYALYAPAGTPPATIDRLGMALQKAIATPAVRTRLTEWGLSVGYVPPTQLAAREHAYRAVWKKIIADSGFKPQ